MPVFDIAIFDPDVFDTGSPPVPPSPSGNSFAVGGGGGKSGVDLEELEVFRKLKRLMADGKSLQQAMRSLDEPEVVKESLPRKITPKMQKRMMDPTIMAWVETRIDVIEGQIQARLQAADVEEEEAISFILPHLL